MVALAMLCGCDYGVGACGSSITTAVTFIHSVPEHEIIPRLISWVSEPVRYEELSRWATAPGRCDRCGHVGRTHAKNGCPVCATNKGCEDLGHKAKVAEVKREVSLRSRAVSCGMPFPEPKIMKEFLDTEPEKIDLDSLKTPVPSLIRFTKLMSSKLDWSEKYCVLKFLPLLTKWHLQSDVSRRTLKPRAIKKKRNPRGVPSYEVEWEDIDEEYEALIPDDQFNEDEDRSLVWTTTERQDLMRLYYPEVVDIYEESIKKPPKEKKTRIRKKKENDNPDKPKRKYTKKIKEIKADKNKSNHSFNNIDLKEQGLNYSKTNLSVSVNKLKRKLKTNAKKKQKTIDSFIASKRRKSSKSTINSLRCSFKNMSICNDNYGDILQNDPFPLAVDNKENMHSILNLTGDSVDDINLSDIIDNILSRQVDIKTAKVNNKMVNLIYDCKQSTPRKSLPRKSVLHNMNKNHCSTPKGSPVGRKSFNFGPRNSRNSSFDHHSFERKKSINTFDCKANTSYFFDKLTEERDAFEISLECKHASAVVNLDCDTTVDYSLPDVCL